MYVGLALLLQSRLQDIRSDLWVDGVIAALAIAAVGAALVFDVIVETTGGDAGPSGRTWPTSSPTSG